MPKATPPRAETVPDSLQLQVDRWLVNKSAPPAVLVNDQGDILIVSGRTGRYLEPAAGKANLNVFAMAREGLRYQLGSIFQKARTTPGPVVAQNVYPADRTSGNAVDISVEFLTEPEGLRGLAMILFSPTTQLRADVVEPRERKPGSSAARVRELERELAEEQEEVRRTREVMQSSQEELRSVNEELQSTNEELQSTNEELTTSKEEMQSLNEELQTVNAELESKLEELSSASNDMNNLLNSTRIATIFLDNELRVRRFTEQAKEVINLIPTDVGRPITDLSSNLLYPGLATDSRKVLQTLIPIEKALADRGGHWFAMRLMPYRTADNRINGVVITFTDMTVVGKLQAELALKKSDPP